MAQKQSETAKPENENTPATGTAQNTGNSTGDIETASAVASQNKQGGNNVPPDKAPAATPGDTADLQVKSSDKARPAAQKTASKADQPDEEAETSHKRTNGGSANGKTRSDDDRPPVRRDRQIAQGRHQDDDPGYGRQPRRNDDYDRPATRRDDEQRNLFGEPDDTYYDRRPHAEDRDRDADYDRGRRAAQGYGHTAARNDDERLSREYGSDYRRYSQAEYDERHQYQSRDRALNPRAYDQGPYGDRDRYYSEGGQYRSRPQGYRPNDNGRDFEREAREQPRNRWRESNVDPRYDDAYDNHRNRAWSSQGNQDRHRDWDRDDQGRYSNARYQDEGRYSGQDRGYDQSSDRFGTRGDRSQGERGVRKQSYRGEPVAGNRSNYPAARENERGNTGRPGSERRDYRETQTDGRYEDDRAPWRRR